MSSALDLSGLVSRSLLRQAMADVWRRGDRAPGPDGLTHGDVFGDGPQSPHYQATERRLGREKHQYFLGPAREAVIFDEPTGKQRTLSIVGFHDRIMLRAVALAARRCLPASRVSVCTPGLDSRWSVARAALYLRTQPGAIALRSDLLAAFRSLSWRSVLRSGVSRVLMVPAKNALTAIYEFYGPTGTGVPMGLPTSTLMLDLACIGLDGRLAGLGDLAFRYVDDVLLLGADRDLGERFLQVVREELGPFGLAHHPAKTALHDDSLSALAVSDARIHVRRFPLVWLGYEISARGDIRVSETALSGTQEAQQKTSGAQEKSLVHHPAAQRISLFDPRSTGGANEEQEEELRQQEGADNNTKEGGAQTGSRGRTGFACIQSSELHPSNAPESGGRPMRSPEATDDHAGGGGRGRRSAGRLRLPRPNRTEHYGERLVLLGGLPGLLRGAAAWSSTSTPGAEAEEEARILFGESAAKAHQLGRAFKYWQLAKAALETIYGARIAPSSEDQILDHAWSVLMSAATLTEVEAVKFCVTDPVEQILQRLVGRDSAACRQAIEAELTARTRRDVPLRTSLWGRLTTQGAGL